MTPTDAIPRPVSASRVAAALVAGVLAAVLPAAATGCAGGPERAITVALGPTLAEAETIPTLEVEMTAAAGEDRAELARTDVGAFFEPGSGLRARLAGAGWVQGSDRRGPVTLRASDEAWRAWAELGASEVFVLANLPGVRPVGGLDPRRLVIPLDGGRVPPGAGSVVIERGGLRFGGRGGSDLPRAGEAESEESEAGASADAGGGGA